LSAFGIGTETRMLGDNELILDHNRCLADFDKIEDFFIFFINLAPIFPQKTPQKILIMKHFALILTILFSLSPPISALEYQGRNLDGQKIAAKAYYQRTGGVYNVQVRFNGNRATLFFDHGGQITIQLRQSIVTDLNNIQGRGRLGHVPVANSLSLGLEMNENEGKIPRNSPLNDLWQLSISPEDLQGF
jgi:hypothetical protein